MPVSKKTRKNHFFETPEGMDVIATLKMMDADDKFNTKSSYSANSGLYPDHQIPFVDKHVEYLRCHPSTDPEHYLANLRLVTRIRTA
jgi:hypothetical protein